MHISLSESCIIASSQRSIGSIWSAVTERQIRKFHLRVSWGQRIGDSVGFGADNIAL